MKIIITHGYFLNEDAKEIEIMKPRPPLGLLYISAYLEKKGIDNDVFDSTFSDIESLKIYLLENRPEVIGIYTNLMTKLNVLRIIGFVRENKVETKIVLGGPEVRYHKESFLKHGADVIVFGEGEETMFELIKAFKNNGSLHTVHGIAFMNESGEVIINAEREQLQELDELPLPNRSKISMQKYFTAWKEAHGQSVISMSTMRGCPYDCKWCSRAVYGQSYRRRSAVCVVEEIKQLQAQYRFDSIWFVDDVFTINYPWLREFAAEIQNAQLTISYEIITRADRMTDEIVSLLKISGCYRVGIGAESGSQKIINAMSRRVKVEQVRSMIQLTQKHGMQAGTFIMLGYPGETEEDIAETLHHLKVSSPDLYTLTVAYPIKGTPLYSETENIFIESLPWESSTDRQIDFKRTYPRKYYDFAIRWIYNEVHVQKKIRAKQYGALPILKLKSIASRLGMFYYKHG